MASKRKDRSILSYFEKKSCKDDKIMKGIVVGKVKKLHPCKMLQVHTWHGMNRVCERTSLSEFRELIAKPCTPLKAIPEYEECCPTIIQCKESFPVLEGDTYYVSVKIKGNPVPKINIYKGISEVFDGGRHHIVTDGNSNTVALCIYDVSLQNDKEYRILVYNRYGKDVHHFKLFERVFEVGAEIQHLIQEFGNRAHLVTDNSAQLCRFPPPCVASTEFSLVLPDMKRLRLSSTLKMLGESPQNCYLNDDIIDFYLQYIINVIYPSSRESIKVLSSFFYPFIDKYVDPSVQRKSRFLFKENLFQRNFIMLPVAIYSHWMLLLVCYPNLVNANIEKYHLTTNGSSEAEITRIKSNVGYKFKRHCPYGNKIDEWTKRPCIMVMNSYDHPVYQVAALSVYIKIQRFLEGLWFKMYGEKTTNIRFDEYNLPFFYPNCPQQTNKVDCGVFLLHFAELVIANPAILQRLPPNLTFWFKPEDIDNKRYLILKLFHTVFLQDKVFEFCKCKKETIVQQCLNAELEKYKQMQNAEYEKERQKEKFVPEIEKSGEVLQKPKGKNPSFDINSLLQLLCDLNIIEIFDIAEPPFKRSKPDTTEPESLNEEDQVLLNIISALCTALLQRKYYIKIVESKSPAIQESILKFITEINENNLQPPDVRQKMRNQILMHFISSLLKERENRAAIMDVLCQSDI